MISLMLLACQTQAAASGKPMFICCSHVADFPVIYRSISKPCSGLYWRSL